MTDGKGHTALHAAIIGKKENSALLLVEKGSGVDAKNIQNRNALHFAAFSNMHCVIEGLIRKGCSVNLKDDAGDTPLHDAVARGNKEAAAILLRAAKIDLALANRRGFNPLQFACFTGNTFATEAILKRDASTVNLKKTEDQFSALHIAAVNDHVECAKLLIEVGKATVDLKGGDGYTPLHLACHEAYLAGTEFLLKKGADPNVKDNKGNTALHIAIGASKMSSGGSREADLFAALLGMRRGNDDEVRVKLSCLLLKNNAVLDAKNNNGRTPLDCAQSTTVKQAVLFFVREQGDNIRRAGASAQGEGVRIRLGPGGHGLFDLIERCAKCRTKMPEITLLPCNHKVLCRQCCLETQNCPKCGRYIERRIAKKETVPEPECRVQ